MIELTGLRGSLDLRCHMAGRFAVDHKASPAGEAPFHFVLSGRCVIELARGETLVLTAGDFVFLPRGRAHSVRDAGATTPGGELRIEQDGALPLRRNTDGAADLDLLCGRFHHAPGSVGLLMTALPDALHVSLTDGTHLDSLCVLIALLRTEVELQQPGALAIVTVLSHALLVMALRAHVRRSTTPACILALLVDPRLGRAVQAMLREPSRAWSVKLLAGYAAMSRATFARRFQARGGISPWELLTRLRMHIAAELLSHELVTVAIVAQRVGYESEAAFGKVFRRHFGVTPARYRRKHRA